MKTKTWPLLTDFASALNARDARAMKPAIFDVLADRIEAALAAEDSSRLVELSAQLEVAVREALAASGEQTRKAMRGDRDADPEMLTLFLGGHLAFAQNLAARALDRRVDDAFFEQIHDVRYERYIRALLGGGKSGKALAEDVGETEETVSRKLRLLEEAGIVQRVRRGQLTFNLLTPAARDWLTHKNVSPLNGRAPQLRLTIQDRLAEHAQPLPDHLRAQPVLGAA